MSKNKKFKPDYLKTLNRYFNLSGKTLTEIAKSTKLTPAAIHYVLKGVSRKPATIKNICKIIKLPYENLVR